MASVRRTVRKLSRERAIEAAIHIADRDGIDALTMRRLADELHAGAMSVYHHIPGKDQLLGAMVDRVVGEMDLPSAGGDWKAELKRAATSAHEVLIAHPWAAGQILSGPLISEARLRQMNAILGCLRDAGFSADLTDHAYHALDAHIMGFTLWLVGISAGMERIGDVRNALELFAKYDLPDLTEHAHQHMRERAPDEPGEFEFGLDLLLDGLDRLGVG